jgi:hypothetical protein
MIARAIAFLRERGASIAVEGIVNFIGPYVIYALTKKDLGEVGALMASSAPPIIWSLIEFARHRRVDALSILVLAGIALSLLAFLGGGGPKFLQMRERMVTALIGLAFVVSALIGKPLIYQLARATLMRRSASELESFDALKDNIYFKRTMATMTWVWGISLLAEAAVGVWLVFVLSVQAYLIAGKVLGYGTMGALALWNVWYVRRARAKGDARQAAEAAAVEAPPPPEAPA